MQISSNASSGTAADHLRNGLRSERRGRKIRIFALSPVVFQLLLVSCTLQDYAYLESGVRGDHLGGTSGNGGAGEATTEQGGAASNGSTDGGATSGRGGTTASSSSSLPQGLEPDPDLPVPECGSTPCSDDAMIIDMEANDGKVCSVAGRSGVVLFYGDGTGHSLPTLGNASKFSPLESCRGTSSVGLHTKGLGYTSWGAGMAISIAAAGFDASSYSGILLWGRSSSSTEISIAVATLATQDVAYGGACKPSGGKQCNDHFMTKRTLTPSWVAYPVSFAELHQGGWGMSAPTSSIDVKAVIGLNITTAQGAPYDYWLDDITFTQ